MEDVVLTVHVTDTDLDMFSQLYNETLASYKVCKDNKRLNLQSLKLVTFENLHVTVIQSFIIRGPLALITGR